MPQRRLLWLAGLGFGADACFARQEFGLETYKALGSKYGLAYAERFFYIGAGGSFARDHSNNKLLKMIEEQAVTTRDGVRARPTESALRRLGVGHDRCYGRWIGRRRWRSLGSSGSRSRSTTRCTACAPRPSYEGQKLLCVSDECVSMCRRSSCDSYS